MSSICVKNEWSSLKSVFIGLSNIRFPEPNVYVFKGSNPLWLRIIDKIIGSFFAGKKIPKWLTKKFIKENTDLEKTLKKFNIKVYRPHEVFPQNNEPLGLSQVFPRDPIIVIDNKIIYGYQKIPALRKETRGIKKALDKINMNHEKYVLSPQEYPETYLEGGDVLVDLPYVFVGIGDVASNKKGADWLQKILGNNYKVIPVKIIKKGINHLDTCLTLIGKKKGIICKEVIEDPLPFPLCDYEFINVKKNVRKEIGINIIMVNPNTIIIQQRHKTLKNQLLKKGYNVISLDFTWHALSGGAFRCATHPLIRKD